MNNLHRFRGRQGHPRGKWTNLPGPGGVSVGWHSPVRWHLKKAGQGSGSHHISISWPQFSAQWNGAMALARTWSIPSIPQAHPSGQTGERQEGWPEGLVPVAPQAWLIPGLDTPHPAEHQGQTYSLPEDLQEAGILSSEPISQHLDAPLDGHRLESLLHGRATEAPGRGRGCSETVPVALKGWGAPRTSGCHGCLLDQAASV